MTPLSRTPGTQPKKPKETVPLRKTLCDISGIIHIVGFKGIRYFILFIDEVTNYVWIYFLTSLVESEIINALDTFFAEIQSGRYKVDELFVTQKFKTDCASQFTSQEFKLYIKT